MKNDRELFSNDLKQAKIQSYARNIPTRQFKASSLYDELKLRPVSSSIIPSIRMTFKEQQDFMRFGNYSCKRYGLIVPTESKLSLFERFFLSKHLNKESARNALDIELAAKKSKTQKKSLKSLIQQSKLSYYLSNGRAFTGTFSNVDEHKQSI